MLGTKHIIGKIMVAGCGAMSLLGCHAAVHRFGANEYTCNVLFAVFS